MMKKRVFQGIAMLAVILLIVFAFRFYCGYQRAVGNVSIDYGTANESEKKMIDRLARQLKMLFYIFDEGELYGISYISEQDRKNDYTKLSEEYSQVAGFYVDFHTWPEEKCRLSQGYGNLYYDYHYDYSWHCSWWFVRDKLGLWRFYSGGFC